MTVRTLAKRIIPQNLAPAAISLYLKGYRVYFALYRRLFRPNSAYLAVAEKNYITYFPPEWTSVNIESSDILLDLETDYSFEPNSVRFAYSSHTIEHLTNSAVRKLLRNLYLAMTPGGVLRVECPDLDMLLDDYKCVHNKDRKVTRLMLEEVDRWNMPRVDGIYDQEHIKILAAIVSYYDRKFQMPLPPLCSAAEFQEKISTLSNSEFGDWAASLLTPKQLHGSYEHQNWFNFTKLQSFLSEAGFSGVVRCEAGKTPNNFKIGIERTHRHWYSMYVEVVKR